MTSADHILGIVRESLFKEDANKRIEAFLEPDYVPRNGGHCPMEKHGAADMVNIKPALPGMRCATVVGNDDQSGFIYCGDPAEVFGWSKNQPEVCYIMCERHARRHGIKMEATS